MHSITGITSGCDYWRKQAVALSEARSISVNLEFRDELFEC